MQHYDARYKDWQWWELNPRCSISSGATLLFASSPALVSTLIKLFECFDSHKFRVDKPTVQHCHNGTAHLRAANVFLNDEIGFDRAVKNAASEGVAGEP